MDLWIRSQDKEDLIKVNEKVCIMNYGDEYFVPICADDSQVASFRTKERALEVLDEIQNKLKSILYLKPNEFMRLDDIKAGKLYFEELNKQEFITCDNNFEIIPISTNVFVYEMPEK